MYVYVCMYVCILILLFVLIVFNRVTFDVTQINVFRTLSRRIPIYLRNVVIVYKYLRLHLISILFLMTKVNCFLLTAFLGNCLTREVL